MNLHKSIGESKTLHVTIYNHLCCINLTSNSPFSNCYIIISFKENQLYCILHDIKKIEEPKRSKLYIETNLKG